MISKIDTVGIVLQIAKELYMDDVRSNGLRYVSKKEETERGYTEEQRLKLRAENAIKEAEIFVNTFIEKKGEYNVV